MEAVEPPKSQSSRALGAPLARVVIECDELGHREFEGHRSPSRSRRATGSSEGDPLVSARGPRRPPAFPPGGHGEAPLCPLGSFGHWPRTKAHHHRAHHSSATSSVHPARRPSASASSGRLAERVLRAVSAASSGVPTSSQRCCPRHGRRCRGGRGLRTLDRPLSLARPGESRREERLPAHTPPAEAASLPRPAGPSGSAGLLRGRSRTCRRRQSRLGTV